MTEAKMRVMVAGLLVLCIAKLIWPNYYGEWGEGFGVSTLITLAGAWCCGVWLWRSNNAWISQIVIRRLIVMAAVGLSISIGVAFGYVYYFKFTGRGGSDALRVELGNAKSELERTKWEARQLAAYATGLQSVERERDSLRDLRDKLNLAISTHYTHAISQSNDKAVEVKMRELLDIISKHSSTPK